LGIDFHIFEVLDGAGTARPRPPLKTVKPFRMTKEAIPGRVNGR
jgi:hypothetical protein